VPVFKKFDVMGVPKIGKRDTESERARTRVLHASKYNDLKGEVKGISKGRQNEI